MYVLYFRELFVCAKIIIFSTVQIKWHENKYTS